MLSRNTTFGSNPEAGIAQAQPVLMTYIDPSILPFSPLILLAAAIYRVVGWYRTCSPCRAKRTGSILASIVMLWLSATTMSTLGSIDMSSAGLAQQARRVMSCAVLASTGEIMLNVVVQPPALGMKEPRGRLGVPCMVRGDVQMRI
jgi:hypothetical protein